MTANFLQLKSRADKNFGLVLHAVQQFFAEDSYEVAFENLEKHFVQLVNEPSALVGYFLASEKLVGFVTVVVITSLEYGRLAELGDLWTAPEFRGQGFGKKLMREAEAWCKREHCDAVYVTLTNEALQKAELVQFYAAQGYRDLQRGMMQKSL